MRRAIDRLVAGAIRWVHQRWCALRGHTMAVRCAPGRVSLVCMACGATTPGWRLVLEAPRPAPRTVAATRGAIVVPITGARRRTGRAARPRAA
jgi:hypothetical protein